MGRLRTNTKAPELIKNYPNYCDLVDFVFPNKKIYMEIGCGKGDFLIQQAINNPDIFFLGIEKYSTVILKALKKIKRNGLKINNLFFSCFDASQIDCNIFKNKITKLYLNFSDPWPKKRHAKRRLTSPHFLELYREILSCGATVEFKTDNDGLYKYSLEILKSKKDVKIIYSTDNLYANLEDPHNLKNIQTEYEKKFAKANKNIHKIIWKYN